MPFAERDFLPISALQHLIYCERQCALIHIEKQWVENRFTAEGAVLHRRAHGGRSETRPEARTARGLPLHNAELGLYGVADIVRWDAGANGSRAGPVPVEYKRGRPKPHGADRVQLAAQALCLEEMLGVDVPVGEIFYGKTRRRLVVAIDAELRAETRRTAQRLHALIGSGTTPPAEPGPKCEGCSLRGVCLPNLARRAGSVRAYLARGFLPRPETEIEPTGCEGETP